MGYIEELRRLIGTRPIIMAGVSVIVINNNNEILLQKRTDTGDWGVIGGAMELGESLEEAAHRELYEEAGLKAESMKFVTMLSGKDMYYKYPNGDEIYNLVAVFETREYDGIPTINDSEGSDLRYFHLKEPMDDLNEMARKILSKSKYITWK